MSARQMTPQDQDTFVADDLFSQIEQLNLALEREREARLTAEAESTAKSDLLATVSHEVRTPMGAIISMADLLLATELDEKQRHYADTLRQSGRGLLAILNDILDYSKLSAGRFELENTRFDFTEFTASIEEGLTARAAAKGLKSSVEVTKGCPSLLVGDAVRLRQILNNLIDNALKFTQDGSVKVRIGYGADGPDIMMRFEVCDTGIGLSEAQRAKLFEPYTQGNASVGAKYGGTGLGLSIARHLAGMMDGDLNCDSIEDKGSVFWFTVRLRQAAPRRDAEHESNAGAPVEAVATAPLKGHVLIVEDNEINQMLIQAYLDNFGLTHVTAGDGRTALDILGSTPVDLVLMDIMMPEMDGIETTKHIRALETSVAQIPIIALTANAMRGDRESYLAAGMNGYVSKPLSTSDLFTALSEHLDTVPAAQVPDIQAGNAAESTYAASA